MDVRIKMISTNVKKEINENRVMNMNRIEVLCHDKESKKWMQTLQPKYEMKNRIE